MGETPDTVPSNAPLQIDELLTPDAYTHPVSQLELRETAISWIVLTGSLAYKIKKPLKLDYIDASTLQRRRHFCEEELRLNRRLAPDLYVDVVPITRIDGRVRVTDSSRPAIEYAVRMRQFDAQAELATLLRNDDVSLAEIEALAQVLGRFHLHAPMPRDATGFNTQHLYEAVFGNLDQLLAQVEHPGTLVRLRRLVAWTCEMAAVLESCFRSREQAGMVRECHGDLHSANIVRYRGQLLPFDCIDFEPRLRWIDVINDVAFLVMDLVAHDREELACALLNEYLEVTGDYDGVRLLPFCAVYRALIRAKVDALAAAQSPAHAPQFRSRLRQRTHTALHWIDRPPATLLLMHGPSGSGKSWLSERLVTALPALRIRSDLERKRLAGAGSTTGATSGAATGLYEPQMSHRTYARLLEAAESCLQGGFHAIVDAAFLSSADRDLFIGLASRMRAPLVIVSCRADPSTLRNRVQLRGERGNDPSDADQLVLEAQLRDFEPLRADEQAAAVVVDTGEPDAVYRVVGAVAAHTCSAHGIPD